LALAGAGLVVAAMAMLAAPWPLRLGVGGVALVLAWRQWRYPAPCEVRRVQWTVDGDWLLDTATDDECVAALESFRILGTQVLLTVRVASRRPLTLWLAVDNSDVDTRRQLRMRLGRLSPGDLGGTV
jgi:hypothetical protein